MKTLYAVTKKQIETADKIFGSRHFQPKDVLDEIALLQLFNSDVVFYASKDAALNAAWLAAVSYFQAPSSECVMCSSPVVFTVETEKCGDFFDVKKLATASVPCYLDFAFNLTMQELHAKLNPTSLAKSFFNLFAPTPEAKLSYVVCNQHNFNGDFASLKESVMDLPKPY